MTGSRTLRSYCRTCTAHCEVLVEVRDDRVVKVTGDPDHPLSRGYTCPKGRARGALQDHSERLDETRVHLHARDAADAGIEDEAAVRATSAHGGLEGRAKIDPALRPGAVWVSHGWPELCVSDLTRDRQGVDPLTGMVEQSGLAVRIHAVN